MAGNAVTLEFAGDAKKLAAAGKDAERAVDRVADSTTSASEDFRSASRESENLTSRIGSLGAGVTGMTDAVDSASGTLQAFVDMQNASYERAQRQERALVDVRQAQEDYNQALRDSKQAAIDSDQAEVDLEQARLDQATALKDYNKAVREHGRNSDEARQAQIDLKQAGVDVKQAHEDTAQAIRDQEQASIDAKDAQLNLNDAQKEANPTDFQKLAADIEMFTPILTGLVGVVGLVTAAQWAWNAAQLASPTTWIILAIVALVAVIVLIATKTTWFQDLWKWAWGGIKDAASAVGSWFKDTLWGKWIKGSMEAIIDKGRDVWNWMKELPDKLKSAFSRVNSYISAPFRAAFNAISNAWNNTIGRLNWTIPGWVPGVGGNSISAPTLPKFHSGGVVPGAPGSEMLAILQAGETVTPAGSGSPLALEIRSGGTALDDLLVEVLSRAIRQRGGNVQAVLGGRNA